MRVDDVYGAGFEVKDNKEGRNGTVADVHSPGDMTDTTRHVTPSATCLVMNSASVPIPLQKGIGIPATSQEIFIQTPTGMGVPEHEVQ